MDYKERYYRMDYFKSKLLNDLYSKYIIDEYRNHIKITIDDNLQFDYYPKGERLNIIQEKFKWIDMTIEEFKFAFIENDFREIIF